MAGKPLWNQSILVAKWLGCLVKITIFGWILAIGMCGNHELVLQLLEANVNRFSFVLTYKLSQDHLELLFACIREKNGFDNNPDMRQFKSALGEILLRVSVVGSRYSNCMTFENEFSSPVYSLKWSRKKSSLTESDDMYDDASPYEELHSLLSVTPPHWTRVQFWRGGGGGGGI